MEDPVYESGVTAASISRMVSDLADVLKGDSTCISTPVPIGSVPPKTSISFIQDTDMPIPMGLNLNKQSRRTFSYNLKHGISSHSDSEVVDKDSKMYKIQDVIERFGNSILDDNEDYEDIDEPKETKIHKNVTEHSAPPSNVDIIGDKITSNAHVNRPRRRARG